MNSPSEQTLLLQSTNDENRDDIAGSNINGNQNQRSDCAGNMGFTNMTVISLAVTTFVQSYLLEGVFPYAGFLTLHLLSSQNNEDDDTRTINEETVGRYAGFVACSFMAGRTITALFWGKLGDTYGRIFVLKASLLISAITSLGFGFASTYRAALLWRFFMGVGNGITGTIKCLLSEIQESSGSQARETKTMALVYGMRGYGFLICPAITGYLSDPMQQYSDFFMKKLPKCIVALLVAYPFVLPNLLACLLCLGAYQLVSNNVEETLPEEKRQQISFVPPFVTRLRQRIWPSRISTNDSNNETNKSTKHNLLVAKGSIGDTGSSNDTTTVRDLLWNSGIRNHDVQLQQQIQWRWNHLYVYWMFSFLKKASDELFPLFCLSKLSGLSLQENQISFILGGTTIIFGLLQYALMTGLVQKIGLYPTLRIAIFGCIPPVILIPTGSLWLASINQQEFDNDRVDSVFDDQDGGLQTSDQHLNVFVIVYLCTIIALTSTFSSITFSTITMATNRTVETIDQRATLNGIATLGGSFAKACGPVFSGTLFSLLAGNTVSAMGISIPPPYGSIVTYGIISIFGLVLSMQSFALRGNLPS